MLTFLICKSKKEESRIAIALEQVRSINLCSDGTTGVDTGSERSQYHIGASFGDVIKFLRDNGVSVLDATGLPFVEEKKGACEKDDAAKFFSGLAKLIQESGTSSDKVEIAIVGGPKLNSEPATVTEEPQQPAV